MPNFNIQPTGGTATGNMTVSINGSNATGANKLSTITISNGAVTRTVSVKQKYRPVLNQFASTTFPATGGNIYFTVKTEYDIVFRSVPTWITITQDGTTYAEGQRIAASVANNKTFTLTAAANTGDARTVVNSMNMAHYLTEASTICQYVSYFAFSQEGAAPIKNITLSPTLVQATSAQTWASLTMTTENCQFDHMTTSTAGTFTIVASNPVNNIINITFPANTEYESNRGYITFYLYDTDGDWYPVTVTVVRAECDTITTDVDEVVFEYNETAAKTFNVLTGGNWGSTINDNS